MTDLLSNLPLELRGQILSLSRNDALAQMAIVSRTLSNDAINVLYSDIDGPWPLIQLLEIESRAEFLKDGFVRSNITHCLITELTFTPFVFRFCSCLSLKATYVD